MNIDLTVLMPVYNAGKYIAAAMESILNQSFTSFEFLIIDDGSTDNSIAIIQSFKDERIRLVINEQNIGITATLNKGLRLASASLVARMDADDISHPQRLLKQFDYFRHNSSTVLLSTSVRVITTNAAVIEEYRVSHLYNCYNLNFICPIYHPTVMFKKEAVLDMHGYLTQYSEDYELWCRLYRVYKIDHLDEMLLDYRLSTNSLSNVDKKIEYDESGRQLLLENLRYYAGEKFDLTFNEAECYRNVFEPLCSAGRISEMVTCIKKLDFINEKICASFNVNYKGQQLVPFAAEKREYTVSTLFRALPKITGLLFLVRTGSLQMLFPILKNKIKRFLQVKK